MKVALTRERRIVLLRWLKQGFIETMDLPECYKGYTYFEEVLKELPVLDDDDIDEIRAINHERAARKSLQGK